MKGKFDNKEGITLVALIVTVIVLMVLAGLTLTLVLGQNGMIGKAKEASAQTKQSTAEEDLKMMLAEYYTNKQTGDTETLKDYLDKQVTAGKIASEQTDGSNYDVILEGYLCTVDSNTLDIISSSKNIVPQANNIKVVSNNDGTGDNLGEQSTTSGTTLYITFTAIMSDGSNATASPNIPFAVTQNGTYNFTITGKVDGKDISKTILVTVNQYKPILAKVGDFVNYNAGTWTQADISSLGSLYSGASLPTNNYQFGGFKAGDSRNNSINITTTYGAGINKYSSGWRVLSLNGDGSIQNIVHAGTPEGFYYMYGNAGQGVTTLRSVRKWDMYVNSQYAILAYCMTYNEVYSISGSTSNDLRTTGSYYWLASANDSYYLKAIDTVGYFDSFTHECLGVRPVVILKSGIQITGGSGTQADPYQMK